MNRILVGTNNQNKLREIVPQLRSAGMPFVIPADLGLDMDVEETGVTFFENACLKAVAFHEATGLAVLAEDSGICIDALDGRPGLHSARYAADHDDVQNLSVIMKEMEKVPDGSRGAYYICSLVYIDRDGHITEFVGRVNGQILREHRGTGGFGYDPVFYVPEVGMTMAEMTFDQKLAYSHRGLAVEQFLAAFG